MPLYVSRIDFSFRQPQKICHPLVYVVGDGTNFHRLHIKYIIPELHLTLACLSAYHIMWNSNHLSGCIHKRKVLSHILFFYLLLGLFSVFDDNNNSIPMNHLTGTINTRCGNWKNKWKTCFILIFVHYNFIHSRISLASK